MSYAPTLRGMFRYWVSSDYVLLVYFMIQSCRCMDYFDIPFYSDILLFSLIFFDCSLCMLKIDHRGLFEGSRYPHSPVTSWP